MNAQKKWTSFLFAKESLIVILLFLIFSAFQTQTNNILYFLFDQAFLSGVISDTFTYNYMGDLLGCEQVLKLRESSANHNWFQRNGIFITKYLPSSIAFVLLFTRKPKSRFWFWLLVTVSCFIVLESMIQLFHLIDGRIIGKTTELVVLMFMYLFFMSLGLYVLFGIMDKKEQLRVLCIALPSFLLGSLVWYKWIGPSILPLVT